MDKVQRNALDRVIFRAACKHHYDRLSDMIEAKSLLDVEVGKAGRAMARETSWQAVGDALGISKQAAWERFAEPLMKQQFDDARRARVQAQPDRQDE